jgi:hypothetical protein
MAIKFKIIVNCLQLLNYKYLFLKNVKEHCDEKSRNF